MQMIKLVQNETIKTFKKTSTKILIILSVLALFASAGLAGLISALNDYTGSFFNQDENWKENMKEQIANLQRTIDLESSHYDRESLAGLKAEKETYEIALECNINYNSFYGNNWKSELLQEIMDKKQELILNENGLDEGAKAEKENYIKSRIELLKEDNFSEYIEFEKKAKKEMLDSEKIAKEEYEDSIYLLDLRKKHEIYKEQEMMFDWKGNLYSDIQNMKNDLRTGINSQTGKLLKLEEVENLKDNIKIAEYKLEHDIRNFC